MTLVLPDTSVWVTLFRRGEAWPFVGHGLRTGAVRLCSVVACELYAGAGSLGDKRDVDSICRDFSTAGWIVTPSFESWRRAGILMERYGRLHGRVEPRVHLNDALILLCAVGLRATVLTWNVGHMDQWNRMLPKRHRVPVRSPA